MADPGQEPAYGELRHMNLGRGPRDNEFLRAKGVQRDNLPSLALPWYTGSGDIYWHVIGY